MYINGCKCTFIGILSYLVFFSFVVSFSGDVFVNSLSIGRELLATGLRSCHLSLLKFNNPDSISSSCVKKSLLGYLSDYQVFCIVIMNW